MSQYTYRVCNPMTDYQETINLLHSVRGELGLSDQAACRQVADLCLDKGGILLGHKASQLCAMIGFFYGDPSEDYRDKSVGFFYVAAALPEYRLTRIFYDGLKYTLTTVKQGGATQIRMQAAESDPYTNKLYSRFANPVKKSKTLRGRSVMTYQNDIEMALAYFDRQRPGTRPVGSRVKTG